MKLVNWTDQIDYLVNRKYPGSKAPPVLSITNTGTSSSFNHAQHEKFLADIKNYKEELFKKTQAEVKALYDAEYDKEVGLLQRQKDIEESQRFFNKISANADFVHWSKAAHWSLDEAIALSFGKSPEVVSWSKVKSYSEVSPFVKEYAKRRDLALRALPWKKLFDPVLPSIFFNWAKEIDIELPIELIREVEKRTGITRYWLDEYKKVKAAYDGLQNDASPDNLEKKDKPLNSRERNSLCRIIAALTETLLKPNPDGTCLAYLKNQASLITHLDTQYDGYEGLSKSNLEKILPEAKKILTNPN